MGSKKRQKDEVRKEKKGGMCMMNEWMNKWDNYKEKWIYICVYI